MKKRNGIRYLITITRILQFSRYGSPRSVDDMLDMYEENPVYELRKRAGPDSEHFSRSKICWINSMKNHHCILTWSS